MDEETKVYYKAMKEINKLNRSEIVIARAEEHLKRVTAIDKRLDDANIKYSKSTEHHYMISTNRGFIDYWPSTGKWIQRSNKFSQRGIASLIDHIKKKCS